MRSLVIAGVTSGVGKTTIACALMAAFRARGHRVQPFKVGPDYIDPTHHGLAAARVSRNLDSVLLPAASLRALFARAAGRADVAIVEGVMGLFDGRTGRGEEGSTAEVAKLIGAPVVVVIDAARTSRTTGAIALGCARFDPALEVAGFILNRLGSETHTHAATESVESATGLPVLGALPRDDSLSLPERHLGLVPTEEAAPPTQFWDRLSAAAERHLDLDHLWKIAEQAQERSGGTARDDPLTRPLRGAYLDHPGEALEPQELFPPEPIAPVVTIAVAQDRAFTFYYQDSLDILRAWGAELAPFSPLADETIPPGTQGIYIGGGFPELYADELAANLPMRRTIAEASARGLPVYGECGGLMYLGRALTDFERRSHPMVGLVPAESVMQRRRAALGYRTATALRSTPILEASDQIMGHEFHYSQLASLVPVGTAAYRLEEPGGVLEGYTSGSVLASYVHLHFGSRPAMARRFIAACAPEKDEG